MPVLAYLANQFPSPVEPYVFQEIAELRRRGMKVIPCSARRPVEVSTSEPSSPESKLKSWVSETLYLQPLSVGLLIRASWLCMRRFRSLADLIGRAVLRGNEPPARRVRALLHTLLGACYALGLKGRGVEHIHVHHGYFASWIAMIAARLLGVPFSMTLHGSDLLLHGAYLDVKLRNCAFCVTVSEFNRRFVLGNYADVDPGKIMVQRLGVDPPGHVVSPSPRSLKPKCLMMLAVGRLHPVKDHAFLLRACYELKTQATDFLCVIAGEGPERLWLEHLIRNLRLEGQVKLLGHLGRQQLDTWYGMCDMVVLTSRSEGIPLVLMEAMAHGKTVLAPAITGIPELVQDGKTGFLYRAGLLDDLVAKIQMIRNSEAALPPFAALPVNMCWSTSTGKGIWPLWLIFSSPASPARQGMNSMRILYCNKYNFAFSGTEVYLFELMELMRAHGHEVALFSMADPRGEASKYDQHFVSAIDFKGGGSDLVSDAKRVARALYSREARLKLRAMVTAFRPDVAHVRNIYHHLSPSILWELKAQGVPVVYHLNDFKLLCPSYNMVAHGRACERCHGGKFWRVVTEGCYSGPPGATLMLAAEAYLHKWLHSYESCVTLFLTPSKFAKDKLVENGWDAKKIDVLPHFQKLSVLEAPAPSPNAPILYFGRLSPEKGVTDLLRAMQTLPYASLKIAGEGPQRAELEELARQLDLVNVEFVGQVAGAQLDQLISSSRFTVLPTRAYETLSKSILESYAWGRAVVASDLGSRRELVHEGETGVLYRAGDVTQLAGAISFLVERPQVATTMGAAGRALVAERHSPEDHYVALTRLYERLAPSPSKLDGQAIQLASKPPLRIAFIGGRGVISKYSGIETCYEEIGKRLADMGHDVTVYCRTYFSPAQAEYNGMRLIRLPTIRSKHLETLVHTLLSTIHVVFGDCDIVHYHCLGPALFSFLPRCFGKKTVVTVQGLDWQRRKWGRIASAVLRLGERAAIKLPDTTVVVSRTLQEYYRARYKTEPVYVPNGTKLRQRRTAGRLCDWGLKPEGYVLFLGRFSPEKNCNLLIQAFERIETPVKLVLAGGSSHSDTYVRRLRQHQSERVLVLDWVSGEALDELLTNAMLFVLPSDLEGLSLALLDAMGAGICVLASDVPENCELVDGSGFTFRRGDLDDLERMLRFLISEPAVRNGVAARAREKVQRHYLWDQIAREIESVYLELTGGKNLPTPASSRRAGFHRRAA